MASGTFNTSTSGQTHVNLGFKPKYLLVTLASNSFDTNPNGVTIFNTDFDANACLFCASSGISKLTLPNATNNRLKSIDDDGFTYNQVSVSGGLYGRYFAMDCEPTPNSPTLMMAPPQTGAGTEENNGEETI